MDRLRGHKRGFYLRPILFFLPIFFCSCDVANFSMPQPIDKENIYEFPAGFQGKWLNEPGDSILYFVNKRYLLVISHETDKISTESRSKLQEKRNLDLSSPNSLRTIYYDSLERPRDTVDHYVLRGPYIYEKIGERSLGKGYPYIIHQNAITISKNDTICIDLGQNAFLRQLNKNTYSLNICNRVLGSEATEHENWWTVILLENDGNKFIRTWECSSKIGETACMFYSSPSEKVSVYYLDCQWTTADMLRLIKQGYFEPTSEFHHHQVITASK